MNLILSITIATSRTQVAVFNSKFERLAFQSRKTVTQHPHNGYAEQDADEWLENIADCLREIFSEGEISAGDIGVVGVDSMGPVLVAVDRDCQPLHPAIIWMDRRAGAQAIALEQEVGEDLFKKTYNLNDPANFAPKAIWLKEKCAEVYQRTATLHHANGFIAESFTGVRSLDHTQCALTQLCLAESSSWDSELIAAAGLDAAKLPDIYQSTDVIGTVTEKAAKRFGLQVGIKVVAGCFSTVAAGMGLAASKERDLYISAGFGTSTCLCLDEAINDTSFLSYRHVLPGKWIASTIVDYGGAGYQWFKKKIIRDTEPTAMENRIRVDTADMSRPLIFLPYMIGQRAPIWNIDTSGVLFGLTASMARSNIARAFIEGNAMAVSEHLKLFAERGYATDILKLTGEAVEGEVFAEVLADVTGVPVNTFSSRDVSNLGTAMVAAYGAGMISDFETEAFSIVKARESFTPNADKQEYYAELQQLFSELYRKLEPEFKKIKEIRTKYANRKLLRKNADF